MLNKYTVRQWHASAYMLSKPSCGKHVFLLFRYNFLLSFDVMFNHPLLIQVSCRKTVADMCERFMYDRFKEKVCATIICYNHREDLEYMNNQHWVFM